MIIEKLNKTYINEIVQIALDNYKEEIQLICLPSVNNAYDVIYNYLLRLIDNDLGIVALEQGRVVGYITGININNLFGNVRGIFSPIHAHGAVKENRKKIYKHLYQKAAEIWVSKDIFNHAIALYAQDEETVNTFFWNGFGLRCIDSIRRVEDENRIGDTENKISEFEIRRILSGEAQQICELENNLIQHMSSSPIFMPMNKKVTIENLNKWLLEDGNYIWAAFDKNEAVAYVKLTKDGENFITESEDMMNICGAYAYEKVRGTGIYQELISYVLSFLKNKKIPYCGVDFEAFNLAGSGFWTKYFEPYTFSVVRRVDERINNNQM